MKAEKITLYLLNKRYFVSLIILLCTIFCISVCFSIYKIYIIQKWNTKLSKIKVFAEKTRNTRKQNHTFFQRHVNAPPYYIENKLESMSFLKKEQEKLLSFIHHPAYGGLLQTKIQNIKAFEKQNRLIFKEERPLVEGRIKETHLYQEKAILINLDDLEHILSKIEEVSIGSYFQSEPQPQILIEHFHLKKTPCPMNRLCYELSLKLLRREFTKKKSRLTP